MHILLILLLITSCQNDVNLEAIPLVECAPLPQPVAAAVCFVHNDNIYIWGGRDNFGTNHNDFHLIAGSFIPSSANARCRSAQLSHFKQGDPSDSGL